ncbi:hypothetical protein J1N35_015010 [Gossypium stocksii]|uniref:Uncharacterized protein n=1 Tax=Gossypium stocksii TaxID=47602 RepID=A0A9D4A9Y3_9ROSI|nr:hypothetical protein J1N35_015010 [Gossypium stocksii]
MPAFPSFPKKLLSDAEETEDDEAEVDETRPTPTHPVTYKKATKRPERDEEKTELVSIETMPTTQQDCKTNKLIDDLTKSDDEEGEVPISMFKRKQCCKHATRKSTRPN